MNAVRWLPLGTMLLASWLGAGQRAHAFCRTTTVEAKISECAGRCQTEGHPLARTEPELEYVFNEAGFPGIDDALLRDIFSAAFASWTDVSCDGEPLDLSARAALDTTALSVRDEQDQYSVNVIGHLSGRAWSDLDRSRFAFALTSVRYADRTGELLGADIWFNGGMGRYGICPDEGCTWSDDTVDLPNVATHEIGHFLGLAHSPEDGATMACEARSGQTDLRSLSPDDVAGICAIYPPGHAFRGEYSQGQWHTRRGDSGCAVRDVGLTTRFAPLLGIFGVLALWVSRRRFAQPRK